MPLQIRRGTDAERSVMTQPLAAGELVYITDTQRLFIGNGATVGGIGVTGYTNENAQDAAASLFTTGPHTGISFVYDDATNKINAVVDLSAFAGPVVANVTGNLTGNVTGNLTGNVTGELTGNLITLSGDTVIDAKNKVGNFQQINLETPGLINGNAVFLANLTSFVATVPSATEPVVSIISINNTAGFGGSLSLARARGTPVSPTIVQNGDEVGSVVFSTFAGTNFVNSGGFVATVTGTPTIGLPSPINIDIKVSNGSTVVIAGTVKPDRFEVNVPVVFPNLTTTERGLLTPAVGMIIYNTTGNKFQGYQNTSGTTLEWVNLS